MTARLNVNIDHVATVRQARRAPEPSVIAAAMACEQAGADGITVHLRGDRRHIQDLDVELLRKSVTTYLNLEMAATEEMLNIALDAKPDAVSLVAEKPNEITTEGGLDVKSKHFRSCARLYQLATSEDSRQSCLSIPIRNRSKPHAKWVRSRWSCALPRTRSDTRRARDSW